MFPQLNDKTLLLLRHHNDRWQGCSGIVSLGLDGVVTPEFRGRVDSFLPWREFALSLCQMGRAFLPAPDWLPESLQCSHQAAVLDCSPVDSFSSILEFWQELPEAFQGKLQFQPEELLPLFCAIGDPPRFGTIPGRYPEQLDAFRERLATRSALQPLRILDLGCGTGLGSYELLETAIQAGFPQATLTGVTVQPLEVWMAQEKVLPHDGKRNRLFQTRFAALTGKFHAGSATDFYSDEKYDFIFCNGLAGGRFLNAPGVISGFLASCRRNLAPGGSLFLANHFHEGHRKGVEALLYTAQQQGWHCAGTWHSCNLC